MYKNIANIIVLLRILLIFVVILLLGLNSFSSRILGLLILVIAALLDWLDGHLARKLNTSSKLGGAIDTLGDRITENLLLIFFAYQKIIPLFVPIVFVTRSFISDFIRYIYHHRGIDTFSIHKSRLGIIFVASKSSRALYLISKIAIFFLGGLILVIETSAINNNVELLRHIVFYGSFFLVVFNLLRFILLVYDSRSILKQEFTK